MSNSDWRDSEQESGKPRPAIQGRTELEDSLLAARREDQAQEKRRSAALSQARKARSFDSDPQGKKFLADREKAMAARRADNARLDQEKKPEEFSVSLLDVWEDAAHAPHGGVQREKTGSLRTTLTVIAVVTICAVTLTFWVLSRLPGA